MPTSVANRALKGELPSPVGVHHTCWDSSQPTATLKHAMPVPAVGILVNLPYGNTSTSLPPTGVLDYTLLPQPGSLWVSKSFRHCCFSKVAKFMSHLFPWCTGGSISDIGHLAGQCLWSAPWLPPSTAPSQVRPAQW